MLGLCGSLPPLLSQRAKGARIQQAVSKPTNGLTNAITLLDPYFTSDYS
jgi:hypothetical protein